MLSKIRNKKEPFLFLFYCLIFNFISLIPFRMLAHKFVEESTRSETNSSKQKAKQSWWPFGLSSFFLGDLSLVHYCSLNQFLMHDYRRIC